MEPVDEWGDDEHGKKSLISLWSERRTAGGSRLGSLGKMA